MNKSNTKQTSHYTPAASLAALGLKLQHVHLFDPIHQQVHIAQKTVKYTPTNKLYDGFIALLAGAQGMVEINTRLRADPILHLAFGRAQCAEQSVVQQTLDSCTAENVTQMEHAVDCIYRQHSQGYQHDYRAAWQVLDVDMSGWPCGKKAAFATKGYFANTERNRRGRQLGRVLASRYHEVVVDRLFAGNRQLGGGAAVVGGSRRGYLGTERGEAATLPGAHRCRRRQRRQFQLVARARLSGLGQSLFGPTGAPVGEDGSGVDHRSASARTATRLGH